MPESDRKDADRKEEGRAAADAVGRSARRKLRARREGRRSALRGFGMFGLVGWAVTVPTLVGVALGVWLDSITDGERSWTLALLLAGVAVGCLNAWYWVRKESEDDR
ncbi:MAG: AtpZ/AtpI family protein [Pseudomonadota bacterium]